MDVPTARLLLQSDWTEAVRHKDRELWAGCEFRNTDVASAFTQLKLEAVRAQNLGSMPSADPRFKAKLRNSLECQIWFEDEGCSCSSRFIAPEFSFTHSNGHGVRSVDVSEGTLGICSIGQDLCLWDSLDGSHQRLLSGHKLDVYKCRFFPFQLGDLVVSGSGDMEVKVWSVATGASIHSFIGHTQGVTDVLGRKDGKIMSSSKDGTLKLWDVSATPNSGSTYSMGSGPLNALCVPSDELSDIVMCGGERGSLLAHSLTSGDKVFEFYSGSPINCLASLDGNLCCFGTQDGTITILDIRKTEDVIGKYMSRRGPALGLQSWANGVLASFGDGTGAYFAKERRKGAEGQRAEGKGSDVELSGADCDPVYDIRGRDSLVFTASRDGMIRKYNLPQELFTT